MRELILLRHAHAEPPMPGQADLDLSSVGLGEAEEAARWLRAQSLLPDRVLCSPARRTRETLDVVLAGNVDIDCRLEQAIYEATPGTLAGLVEANADIERLLLVGHNPGLEQLVALMHSGQSGDYRGMPPGSVAVLTLPDGAAVEPGVAQLTAFWWP
jgi:phosphohistidine phosphatase